MAKPYTYPTIFEDANRFTTRFLIDNGYLKPGYRSGKITHYRGERETGSARMETTIEEDGTAGTLKLSYSVNHRAAKTYTYQLITQPSNLGRGRVWYIVCPATGKRCRKLYCIEGRYLSRYAFPKAMYRQQTENKQVRDIKQVVPKWPVGKRTTYAGRHTKAYVRYLVAGWKFDDSIMKLGKRLSFSRFDSFLKP